MAQRLIVEGNDAIALAVLCKRRGLNPPLGYEEPTKFKREFVVVGKGFDGAINQFRISLSESSMTNLGLIVDANDKGFERRWSQIRTILSAKYSPASLARADATAGPKLISEANLPTVGVWIMPDNAGVGYLEHFLANLAPADDELWGHATQVLHALKQEPFNKIKDTKFQKALLHTWLSWQESPGKPFGQALEAGYFDTQAPQVTPFLEWFQHTFQLS